MFSEPHFLPTVVFICLGLSFAGFHFTLAILYKNFQNLNPQTFSPLPASKFSEMLDTLAFILSATSIFLFFLGVYVLPLKNNPLLYVLYWWFTFSLTLCLFFIPVLKIRKNMAKQNIKSTAFLWQINRATTEQKSFSNIPTETAPEDPTNPPTLH